nr:PREDICTED: scavenger receptor cysteine-rich type 1 protein M130-like [Latimeria chalumnae]|eukprot:XP_014353050.1 PREDICTED: scavenger receptor cysteine-rich type 1 protein M130-like [Latimeria chalumnae]
MSITNVVCRQLGCGEAMETEYLPQKSVSVWLDEAKCLGNESSLWECSSERRRERDCASGGVAGVLRSEHKKLRLVSEEYICAGRVEVFYNRSWGTVCSDSFRKTSGDVVCRQMNCGDLKELKPDAQFEEGLGPIWLDDVVCQGHESFLWACPSAPWGKHNCAHKDDVGVICKGFPSSHVKTGLQSGDII